MYYFLALFIIISFARIISGTWRNVIIIPWVILSTPILIGAGLANMELIPALISPWSLTTHKVVIEGTIALMVGSFTLKNIKTPFTISTKQISWNENTLLKVFIPVTVIALVANSLEFMLAGEIPLFSSDPDHARLIASKYGIIHLFGVLSGHIVPLVALVLFTGKSLNKQTRNVLISIMILNFVLLALWVARGMLIYPIVTVVAINYLLSQSSFTLKKIVVLTVLFILIISGVKYLRDVTRFGFNLSQRPGNVHLSGATRGFLESSYILYLTIALNYEVLNQYTAAVPTLKDHSHGSITGSSLIAYLPGSGKPYTELEMQNSILKKNEYDLGLTSTFFGTPYLDFGLTGVLLASFAVGLLYKTVWLQMLKKGSLWSIFFYAYLISMTVFIPYAFLFTAVSFTWFIMISFVLLFLCSCRIQSGSIYYTKNKVMLISD